MREARKYFGFTSWFFRAFRRVAEGVDPYVLRQRFDFKPSSGRKGDRASGGRSLRNFRFVKTFV